MRADFLAVVASDPGPVPSQVCLEERRRRTPTSVGMAARDPGAGIGTRVGIAALEAHP